LNTFPRTLTKWKLIDEKTQSKKMGKTGKLSLETVTRNLKWLFELWTMNMELSRALKCHGLECLDCVFGQTHHKYLKCVSVTDTMMVPSGDLRKSQHATWQPHNILTHLSVGQPPSSAVWSPTIQTDPILVCLAAKMCDNKFGNYEHNSSLTAPPCCHW